MKANPALQLEQDEPLAVKKQIRLAMELGLLVMFHEQHLLLHVGRRKKLLLLRLRLLLHEHLLHRHKHLRMLRLPLRMALVKRFRITKTTWALETPVFRGGRHFASRVR